MTDSIAAKAEEFESLTTTNGRNGRIPQIVAGLNKPAKQIPLGEQSRAVRRQGLMVILGNIGLLSAGMALGMPTVTMRQLTDPNEAVHLSESQASWFASINTLSCPLGGLLSGILLDKLGRKNTLIVLNVIALFAWALMALAIESNVDVVFIQLLVSRFCIGITMGIASAPVGVYSAEISLPRIRGRLILGTSVAISAGIMVIYIIGYFIRNDWQLIAMLCCAYQIVAMFCVIPMPESPSWLVSKGRYEEAKKALNYFRGMEKSSEITHPEVQAEFNLLQKSIQLGEGVKKPPFLECIRQPEVYKPLLILMGLFAFQQLTGIFVVVVYAVQISQEAGVTIDPFMCAVMIGVGRVVTTVLLGTILERWGRRRSGMVSALGMCVCMFLLAGHNWNAWLQRIPYLPVIAIIAFIVLSTFGLYTLPFFMISELFPQRVRGAASGLTVAVGMCFAFICIKTYPALKASLGNECCFVGYGIMAFLAAIYVYTVLPETRGRTLLAIEDQFRTGVKSQRYQAAAVEMQEVTVK
ncbi:PREDICTED: facilitated trehalose transporter Tret1-2 homolog [Rhagoletis zephyria]|uniref:facilitated trehalose transporter Tret1-2 homolog n=1 Tax=Rhagoletis zephyria TaxID=28612 RepID=UPI00081122AF|nr:PREDICTED: facilitated trehalose transporter Tret1-2 homolog [Rhagoletis zephyria]XP_017484597.1 PREDICTED: facilitated trehalose transporter Tret1-2 homolog [Rhagoletis zephyria]XP_036331346.1 facilitated trehalose transporter Tret1-2 homolog [Rhagoletis pomonella]XP_036331347.1 facilitated trehalose transporter Tret1-2 homolog [Rhagoletis pomonella]